MELQGKRLQAGERVALQTYMEERGPSCGRDRQVPKAAVKDRGATPKKLPVPKSVPEESEAEDSGADLKEALAVIAEQEKKMKSLKAKLKGAVVSKGSAASSRQGSDLDDVRSQAPSDMSTSSYKQVAE